MLRISAHPKGHKAVAEVEDAPSPLHKRYEATEPAAVKPDYLHLPDGVLDGALNYDAVVQQNNCVGCDGRGLADGIAKKYPYGCPYAQRRKGPGSRFACSADLAVPGTVDV